MDTANDTIDLQAIVDSQRTEIEELRAQLRLPTASRRSMLKGAGMLAGGLAALGAAGTTGAALAASPASAIVGPDNPYAGSPIISLQLLANGATIPGDSTHEGRENTIEVAYYQHDVSIGVSSGGQASGKRVHKPIVFRKRIDRSTPLLFQALVENQGILATFKFWRPNTDGQEQNYFTVVATNGRLVGINDYSPDNHTIYATDPDLQPPLEEVQLTFQKIKWTWLDGGIEFEDSWNAQR